MLPPRIALAVPFLALPALAQSTLLLSRAPDHGSADGMSVLPTISADARYVVFRGHASNLVPDDTNGCEDIFRCEVHSGRIELVSRTPTGRAANGPSRQSQVSGNGRLVVFQSYAGDLVPGDTNGESDIFVHDMLLGTTERVSVSSTGAQSDGGSRYPYISRDGERIVFESQATNLVPGDANAHKDVFLHERSTGRTRLVSAGFDGSGADDDVLCTSISPDGRWVGFSSAASNLVPRDRNGEMDAFLHDLESGTSVRVSTRSDGGEAHGLSADVSVADGGRFVAFYSLAPDLVPGDTNGQGDVFVKDVASGAIERVSVSDGGVQGNWNSYYPRLSSNGRWVVFFSQADTLVPHDTNWNSDVFLRDRLLGTTERLSVDGAGREARGYSSFVTISEDGRFVAFNCAAPNVDLPDDNACSDIFLRDRADFFQGFCESNPESGSACPCGDPGLAGHGCPNAIWSTGAALLAHGTPALDDVELVARGLPEGLALFVQGDLELQSPALFGHGLSCVGGQVLRLYSERVRGGTARAPAPGEPGLRARAARLGDVLLPGSMRFVQACYRDGPHGGCTERGLGLSSALRVRW